MWKFEIYADAGGSYRWHFFTNHDELKAKVKLTFEKNRDKLLQSLSDTTAVDAAI